MRKEKELIQQWQKHKEQQEKLNDLKIKFKRKSKKLFLVHAILVLTMINFFEALNAKRQVNLVSKAKAIEKRIEQMEIIEKPLERDLFCIDIKPTKSKGGKEIVLVDLIAGYADSKLRIGPISLSIPYGSRIVILGVNGSGKQRFYEQLVANAAS